MHAVQLELAICSYLDEPKTEFLEGRWPPPYEPAGAAKLTRTLRRLVEVCATFARGAGGRG